MRFLLLLLVVALLYIRPSEIFPGLEKEPIYEFTILTCLAASAFALTRLASWQTLKQPIVFCILGLLVVTVLSHLARGASDQMVEWGFLVFKVTALYFLVLANLTNPQYLRRFLNGLAFILFGMTLLVLANHHQLIQIPSLEAYEDKERDPDTGEVVAVTLRLRGLGIFNDPNDLCVNVAIGFMICFWGMGNRQLGSRRWLWAIPALVFLYALTLTHSRGGLLALVAGMLAMFKARHGGTRAILLMFILLPGLGIVFAGRQTQFGFDNPEDTGHYRLRLWSEALMAFRESPLFGIGPGEFESYAGQVAHNSYLEAFAELGFLGGAFFLGAIAYSLWILNRLGAHKLTLQNRELHRYQPLLLSIFAVLAVGMLSLSRTFNPPTYLLLGMVTAYFRLSAGSSNRLIPSISARLGLRLFLLCLFFLFAVYVSILFLVRW